jgi:hypothetical protein
MMEVVDVYAVTEHGGPLGALVLFDTGNAIPGNPAVRVLPSVQVVSLRISFTSRDPACKRST